MNALRSCRDTGGPLCRPGARCPAHRVDVDPPQLAELLGAVLDPPEPDRTRPAGRRDRRRP